MIFEVATIKNLDISRVVQNAIISYRGDGVINLQLKSQTQFIDGLVTIGIGVIGGIVAPPYGSYASLLFSMRTYTVEGDIIVYLDKELDVVTVESKKPNIILEKDKNVTIVLKSGIQLKGQIIDFSEKWIILKRDNGGISNVARTDVELMNYE